MVEDNDAVIKMCVKVRAPSMRHVQRTHQVHVDSLFGRIHSDKGVCIKYINTKLQTADIFTKGSFSVQAWIDLCKLPRVGPIVETNVFCFVWAHSVYQPCAFFQVHGSLVSTVVNG